MFTDNTGFYFFDNLNPGQYYVQFTGPDDLTPTESNQGGNGALDSNVDNSNGPGTTPIVTLGPGENDPTIDAGFYECVLVGQNVWFDFNENDIFDSSENGINGLRVELYRNVNGSFVLWDQEFTGHEPETPSNDGYFKFCVRPGEYYLRFVNPPLTLVAAVPNIGINEEVDSDITGAFGSGTTDAFTVTSGQDRCDLGAGFYPMGTIGDFVWQDDNGNGLRESNELGIEGVVVRAISIEGDEVGESTTDANGQYKIDYLGKNAYYLEFELAPTMTLTQANVGSDESIDSDVDHSNGENTTKFYQVLPGDEIQHVDAGINVLGVLAIEWSDIWVENNDAHHTVSWTIELEDNVSHYEIERSLDGIDNFEVIGKRLALGATNAVTYNYDDYDVVLLGTYYYRVAEVSFNGDKSVSKIVSVQRDQSSLPDDKSTVSIYPNPVVSEVTFDIAVSTIVTELRVDIYDSQGKLVIANAVIDYELDNEVKSYKLNLNELANGVYNVKFLLDNAEVNKKLIVIE